MREPSPFYDKKLLKLEETPAHNRGEAVGASEGETLLAVKWDVAGNPTALLPLPGATESDAWAINNLGDVAGFSNPGFVLHGVVWRNGNTVPTLLPLADPLHTRSEVTDINENGWISGVSGFVPVLWSPTGAVIELNSLPGHASATPLGLNDHLTVVGHNGGALVWNAPRTDH